jgi:hypothetical protein
MRPWTASLNTLSVGAGDEDITLTRKTQSSLVGSDGACSCLSCRYGDFVAEVRMACCERSGALDEDTWDRFEAVPRSGERDFWRSVSLDILTIDALRAYASFLGASRHDAGAGELL